MTETAAKYDPFPNQAPPRPPDPPPWTPATPLEHAVAALIEKITPTHQRAYATMDLVKVDLRDTLIAWVDGLLWDPLINTALIATPAPPPPADVTTPPPPGTPSTEAPQGDDHA